MMPIPDFLMPQTISLRQHAELNEIWLQDRIIEHPELLGLGEVVVRDRERPHPGAGRLDLLLQDAEEPHRYEVEIQLGKTDESHIIRTLEYWDIERKRYPQYEHTAVIVAEEITGRFLNVISLFNGYIPIIALRVQAMEVEGGITLIFTKVLDEVVLGPVDEDEPLQEPTDRAYWEDKGAKKTVEMADRVLGRIHEFAPGYELKYNKHYIGLAKDGQANNFVQFRPQRSTLRMEIKLPKTDETSQRLNDSGLEILTYDRAFGYYKIRLEPGDEEEHEELLTDLAREAHDART